MVSKIKKWLLIWAITVLVFFIIIASLTIYVDPFFHYHKPLTDKFYYTLTNQRSQNVGIVEYFDYDAIITGTSMTENFKTSDMDRYFDTDSIKVTFSGGTYKEVNNLLLRALENNEDVKIVVRGIDTSKLFDDKDRMREDLGSFPWYLYDNNFLTDICYFFNKDIFFDKTLEMIKNSLKKQHETGIDSFDDYSRWHHKYQYSPKKILESLVDTQNDDVVIMDQDKIDMMMDNIKYNLTDIADRYPDVEFYYFFPPYSIAWWKDKLNNNKALLLIDAEKIYIEEMLKHPNIHLFAFDNNYDIITNLNLYRDKTHYGEWVNTLILKWMSEGKYELTIDNYEGYLSEFRNFILNYDYDSLNDQLDYEDDEFARVILNKQYTECEPVNVLTSDNTYLSTSQEVIFDQDILILQNNIQQEVYLEMNDVDGIYNYLVLDCQKKSGGKLILELYDLDDNILGSVSISDEVKDDKIHSYYLNFNNEGNIKDFKIKIIAEIDNDKDFNFVISDIFLY